VLGGGRMRARGVNWQPPLRYPSQRPMSSVELSGSRVLVGKSGIFGTAF
jgi:hypothetical protein